MTTWRLTACLLAVLVAGCGTTTEVGLSAVPDNLVVFKKNGGWYWHQDERAIVVGDQLIFGSVSATTRDGFDRGDICATTYDLKTGVSSSVKLAPEFQSDDHDVPAFLELPDGRILAVYTPHGGRGAREGTSESSMYWRITKTPGDASAWGPERRADVGGKITYTNLFMLSAEGNRIYDFHRSSLAREGARPGRNPNFMISDDLGESFTYGGRLLTWGRPEQSDPNFTGLEGGRPYPKYASNNVDEIHFVTTEDHPRAYDNSIYHGYIKGGQVHASDGTVVGALSTTDRTDIKPTDLTRVFEGDRDNVAWTVDLHLDAVGRPYMAFSVQKDGAEGRTKRGAGQLGFDHRYHYARWDGEQWHEHEIAHAGTRLYPGEADYTGLVALHPRDPGVLYISTNADPVSGQPLTSKSDGRRHWEIFKGVTADEGRTWTWTPVTSDSTADNLRPIIPIWEEGRTILMWLRGRYDAYWDYDLDVVGLVM